MGTKFYLLHLLVSIYSMLTIHVAVCMNDTTYETNTKGEVKQEEHKIKTEKKITKKSLEAEKHVDRPPKIHNMKLRNRQSK